MRGPNYGPPHRHGSKLPAKLALIALFRKKHPTKTFTKTFTKTLPFLQEQKAAEDGEKEAIEMKEEGADEEKGDKEKEDGKAADGKKAKKEKKKKEPKEKKPPGPNCIDIHSAGLDVQFRDSKAINTCIDVRSQPLIQLSVALRSHSHNVNPIN